MHFIDRNGLIALGRRAKADMQFAIGLAIVATTVGSIVVIATAMIAADNAIVSAKGALGGFWLNGDRDAAV